MMRFLARAPMPDKKQQLMELIDAFAIAKASGSGILTQLAVNELAGFLNTVILMPVEPVDQDGGEV